MSDLTLTEQENAIKIQRVQENAVVLANIAEVAAGVIINIAGTDIADSLNQVSLNREVLTNLVAKRMTEQLIK